MTVSAAACIYNMTVSAAACIYNMTVSAAACIYNMVIVPLFSYCSLLKPTLAQTQVNRILSFERRTKEIIGYKQRQKKQVNLFNI